MSQIYIAGASSRARTTKEYLEMLHPKMKVTAFLVSPEMTDNRDEEDGVPVCKIVPDQGINVSCSVYLGTRGVNHEKLSKELVGIGFDPDNIIPVTPGLDMELRNEYVRRVFENEGRTFEKLDGNDVIRNEDDAKDVCIYVAKTIFDGAFSKPVELKDYEHILQAGSGIAERRIEEAEYFDDNGENISGRNRQFCELTAFYWIWKNAKQDVIGLEHWRRRFILPGDWEQKMKDEDIDVILPVPLCVMPSLEGNFVGRHEPKVWDMSMNILKDYHPDEYDKAREFFREKKLYSPCNMIIARREVWAEYCDWLFPMLLKLNEEIGTLEDNYQNRYPGFVSERLLNFFFENNRDRFKVVYADKSFLS